MTTNKTEEAKSNRGQRDEMTVRLVTVLLTIHMNLQEHAHREISV